MSICDARNGKLSQRLVPPTVLALRVLFTVSGDKNVVKLFSTQVQTAATDNLTLDQECVQCHAVRLAIAVLWLAQDQVSNLL